MHLTQNQIAPEFNTYDLYDMPLNLQHFKGKKVLLSFYRYASCPFCNHFNRHTPKSRFKC